jgi:hypothetical protein
MRFIANRNTFTSTQCFHQCHLFINIDHLGIFGELRNLLWMQSQLSLRIMTSSTLMGLMPRLWASVVQVYVLALQVLIRFCSLISSLVRVHLHMLLNFMPFALRYAMYSEPVALVPLCVTLSRLSRLYFAYIDTLPLFLRLVGLC